MGTDGRQESRFLREAESSLHRGIADRVAMVCHLSDGLPLEEAVGPGIQVQRVRVSSRVLPANKLLALIKLYEGYYRQSEAGRRFAPMIVHCHSIGPLAASVRIKRKTGAKLLYDAHELETERAGLHGVRKWVDRHTERRLIRECDAVLCVSDSIADWYRDRYGIERPAVVRNVPDVRTQQSFQGSRVLREHLGLADGDLLFIYQGGFLRGRRIEQLLRVFAQASANRHVVFMGYGELEERVRDAGARHSNIHFHPAVPPQEVLRYTASADVGLVGVENICLSYYFSLPNKLFEYLLAGLPVVAGAWPETQRIVRDYECGWTHEESDEALLQTIEGISPAEIRQKRAGAVRAQQAFSWEKEEEKLVRTYQDLAPTI